MESKKENSVIKGRLKSLDALRGFDMLLLVGIGGVLRALPKLWDNAVFRAIADQTDHTEWHGYHMWDSIFPLFIFMVGASLPFAINNRLERGYSRKKLYIHIVRRTLVLFLLGLIMNGLLGFNFENLKLCGVLQRIGIAYFFAAIIVMNTRMRGQAIISASLLIIYWLLMILVPVPGHGAGVITPEGNLHTYIDQLLLPGRMNNVFYDEDGILQQMSSIAVCLAGVVAGQWLKSSRSDNAKVGGLLIAGTVSILIALLWDLSFPIIFRLWSSSYAMLVIGINSLLLGLFYWLIDVKGYQKWAFPFVVVGLNSITIYVASGLFDFGSVVKVFVHGFIDHLGSFRPLFWALCMLAIKWLFVYFLYKKKIFLKV